MLNSLIIVGALLIGQIDQIEGDVAVVEYQKGDTIEYREVAIIKEKCLPIEGQEVLFDDQKIIVCLCQIEIDETR